MKNKLRKELDTINFSQSKVFDYSKESYHVLIDVMLNEGADIPTIREVLTDKLMDLQDEIMMQNARDVMNGKYKSMADMEKRMPLFRKGNTLLNVPKEFSAWAAFIGTVNEDYI